MEELLNKLLERGWKPFGVEAKKIYIDKNEITIERLNGFRVVYTTRQISSIDSGLWQFCCDNELIKGNTKEAYYWQYKTPLGAEWSKTYRKAHYQHRIIESALCNEDKLEQFLLDNIKVKG